MVGLLYWGPVFLWLLLGALPPDPQNIFGQKNRALRWR